MIELLEEEISYSNDLSYKWKNDNDNFCINRMIYDNIVDSNPQRKWDILTDYWMRFYERGNDYRVLVIEQAEKGNVFAAGAIVKEYLSNPNCESKKDRIERFIDLTINESHGVLAYEYAKILKDDDKDKKYYFDLAYKNGFNHDEEDSMINDFSGEYRKDDMDDSSILYGEVSKTPGYYINNLGSEYADPVSVSNIDDRFISEVKKRLKLECITKGIPLIISDTTLTSGGFKNSVASKILYNDMARGGGLLNKVVFKALKISHPNPPQQYCDELFVFMNNEIRFFYVGGSKAFKDMNEYNAILAGDADQIGIMSKMKVFFGSRPDEEKYIMEMSWHQSVYDTLISIM